MARAGDIIENPLSGERITFEETGAEIDGRYPAGRIQLAPNGVGPPEQVHPKIEERSRVVSGTLSALVNGRRTTHVPPGRSHCVAGDAAPLVERHIR